MRCSFSEWARAAGRGGGWPDASGVGWGVRTTAIVFSMAIAVAARGREDVPKAGIKPAGPINVDALPLLPAPSAEEVPRAPDRAKRQPPVRAVVAPAQSREPNPGPVASPAEAVTGTVDLPADLDALKAETREWLKRIDGSTSDAEQAAPPEAGVAREAQAKSPVVSGLDAGRNGRAVKGGGLEPPSGAGTAGKAASGAVAQPLRDVLVERQLLLDEHDRATKELAALDGHGPDAARLAASARAELERLQPQVSGNSPFNLPPPFNVPATQVTEAALVEMKEGIEGAQNDLKSWQSKLEAARAEAIKTDQRIAAQRTQRDKLFRSVADLKAKGQERESAVTSARTAEERQLARERLTNARLEARVEDLRLKVLEATRNRESSLVEVRQLNERVLESQLQVSGKLLQQMQQRYRILAESQERDLKRAAATEESKARRAEDPLERYRSRRLADLLELEAQVVKNEQALATSGRPSLEEERALADRSESEFAQIKQLLDDGEVSRLDALRLNNDFRRIGPERDGLLRNELSTIEAHLQYYENMLTNVELELIEDSLVDQAEHDALLERLPPERHALARSYFTELENRHRALLERRRTALTKLVARATETLSQVTRRLGLLEEEYGFIRTHIFWVRDQEPIGVGTITQVGHELRRLLVGLGRLAREVSESKAWGQPSTEFLGAAAAALILPLGLFRIRRLLRRRITRALPPSQLHGDRAGTIRVDMSV